MKNIINEQERRNYVRNLLSFLEENKESIKIYQELNQFRQNINNLYISVKNASYDSIEFDVPENIDIMESDSYYYYSESNIRDIVSISIIGKNLEEFYFMNIINNKSYKITKYYKNKKDKVAVTKKHRNYNSVQEANKYKSLILKPIMDN